MWFPNNTAIIAIICKNDVSLPSLLGCHVILRLTVTKAVITPSEKNSSLLRIITNTQTGNLGPGHSVAEESKIHAIINNSLSAIGSRYLPKFVVSPILRAR